MENGNNDDENDVTNQYHAIRDSIDAMAKTRSIVGGHSSNYRNPNQCDLTNLSSFDPSVPPELIVKEKSGQDQDQTERSDKTEDADLTSTSQLTWMEKFSHFYEKEGLLIEVVLAIFFARLYPQLGAIYLFPDVTAHWIAVIIIFCKFIYQTNPHTTHLPNFELCYTYNVVSSLSRNSGTQHFFLVLSGFALKTEQLSAAASNGKFNVFVILYNFIGISCVVNFVAKFFYRNEIVSEDLMKGMIICSCLSMPTNMMVVLAVSSKGDEAVALFLATVMNMMGVFVTPLLIFFYLQENAEIDFINTYKTISLRVLFPVAAGIWIRKKVQGADEFALEYKRRFLKIRERCLVYVVYATFCTTFMSGSNSTRSQICIMSISQVILLASSMFIAWIALFIFFNRKPKLRVVGLFGCSTKTAALGIPLISAIYEDSPKLGIYTLPLLVWYPSQLIIGTMLAPRLSRFIDYKINKYEIERATENFDDLKGCGLLQ